MQPYLHCESLKDTDFYGSDSAIEKLPDNVKCSVTAENTCKLETVRHWTGRKWQWLISVCAA